MKKLICILLSLMTVLSLAACGEKDSTPVTESAPLETPAPAEPETVAPETAPAPTAAEEPDTADSPLEGLVYTSCDKTYVWVDRDGNTNTVRITLPALHPLGEFAEAYNAAMESSSGYLFSSVEYDKENGNPADILSVSYDAWLNDSLLTILLTRENANGEPVYEVATFDLEAQKQLPTAVLSELLLDMSYPSFLLAGTEFMAREYRDTYYRPDMTEDELDTFEVCGSSIGYEPWLLLYRELYLNEAGEIMFLYPRIRPTEDWYAGINSDDAIVTVDPEQFLSPMGEEEAMGWLLSLQPSGMGADQEVFGHLLINAFVADPEAFILGLAALDEVEREHAINSLFYSIQDDNRSLILDSCLMLMSENVLTGDAMSILRQIYNGSL